MITVDAHIDLPWRQHKHGMFDFSQRQSVESTRTVDLPRMQEGGLSAFFGALYLPDSWQDTMTHAEIINTIFQQLLRLNTNPCNIVHSIPTMDAAIADEKIPVFVGLEGGRLLCDNIRSLDQLVRCGVKYLTITHNRNTSWANSATDTPANDPLTQFGRDVLQRCNELSIWIDVSHAHDTTIEAVLHYIDGTLVATHSGVRALVDHPRNLPDGFINEMDMIGVPFARKFIAPYRVADHIDHICQQHGSTHKVGIGSDLDGAAMVDACPDVSKWNHWMEDLSQMGYSDHQIADIAGNNWLRLL